MVTPQISFIIPLFNEAKVFSALVERLNILIQEMNKRDLRGYHAFELEKRFLSVFQLTIKAQ